MTVQYFFDGVHHFVRVHLIVMLEGYDDWVVQSIELNHNTTKIISSQITPDYLQHAFTHLMKTIPDIFQVSP